MKVDPIKDKDHKVLINFYVSRTTRNRFDGICRASGKTRTQVLVALMNEHVSRSQPILEAHYEKLKEADRTLAAIKAYENQVQDRMQEGEAEMPPAIFWSDEQNEVPFFF